MTGVGGGSLMTPVLILLFGVHPTAAVGTDLLYAAVTKTGGALVHGFSGTIRWKVVWRRWRWSTRRDNIDPTLSAAADSADRRLGHSACRAAHSARRDWSLADRLRQFRNYCHSLNGFAARNRRRKYARGAHAGARHSANACRRARRCRQPVGVVMRACDGLVAPWQVPP